MIPLRTERFTIANPVQPNQFISKLPSAPEKSKHKHPITNGINTLNKLFILYLSLLNNS